MVFILTTPVTALQLLQRTKAELTSSTKLSEVSCSRCCAFSGLVLHIRQLCFPDNCAPTTGAVPAMKPEADAIGDLQDGRWKITLMFDGCRFCIPKFGSSTLQQTTCQWRHWWFPTMSSFRVTNHSEAASLWLVRQDWATINSGCLPSCDVTFWQWSVASPSEMGRLASKVSRYLSILCLWHQPTSPTL